MTGHLTIFLFCINFIFCYGNTDKFPLCDNCTISPDAYLNTAQIIRRHGYPSETHIVETEDGYLLTIHRIPGSKDGHKGVQPVFLQHGLLSSSADWVAEDEASLGFMLADLGYDVWLGNARGNTYSTAHVSLDIHTPQFWNFSFYEVGYYDLPASIYFVSNVTDKPGEILYIGHSMGTTSFFIFAATRPDVAKNIKLMVALAPVAYMTHIRSPIKYLAPFSKDFAWLAKHLGLNQILPNNKVIKFLAYECEKLKVAANICNCITFAIAGFDKKEFNDTLLPVVFGHDPAGSSTKTFIHYAQEIYDEGNFQYFDYGEKGNMIIYNQPNPPQFNLGRIKRPIYLMYAENDWLSSPIDVERFASNVSSVVGLYKVPMEVFNHVDFLFGKDVVKLVYKPLIKVLRNYTYIEQNYIQLV